MGRRIVVARELTPASYGLAPVDAEAVIATQVALWQAADPVFASKLVEGARSVARPVRQTIADLLAVLASDNAVAEAGARLSRLMPAALPQLLLSLRPQVDRHLPEFFADGADELRVLGRAEAVPAFFSLLEHPSSPTDDSVRLATSAIARLCSTQQECEFTAAEEHRFLALLDAPHAPVRSAVADTLASTIAWTLACPNPTYEAEPSDDAVQRYERWFGALTRRAHDSVIVPALARAARENRDHRALPLLRELGGTGTDEARAAAVAAVVELGGAAEAESALQQGSPHVQRAGVGALSTRRLRALLRDPVRPIELRVHALEVLCERRTINGTLEFGEAALLKLARDATQPLVLRRAAFARLPEEFGAADPLSTELGFKKPGERQD